LEITPLESIRPGEFPNIMSKDLVTELPSAKNGMVSLSDKPGLGLELRPDLHKRADAAAWIPMPNKSVRVQQNPEFSMKIKSVLSFLLLQNFMLAQAEYSS